MWSQPLHFSSILAITTAGTGLETVGAADVLGTVEGEAETFGAAVVRDTATGDAETEDATGVFGTAKGEAEVGIAAGVSRQTGATR